MENINKIKESIEDSAIRNKLSLNATAEKYEAVLKTYRNLFDRSIEKMLEKKILEKEMFDVEEIPEEELFNIKNMVEEDIDTFFAASCLLKAIILNKVGLDKLNTCKISVDACIDVCRKPMIIEKGKLCRLCEADYTDQEMPKNELIDFIARDTNSAILNSDITTYLRNMYINAPKITEQNITSTSHYQKLKSIFSKE